MGVSRTLHCGGLSDDGPRPRDGRRIATELHHALRTAGIAPPYVLVGASLGGPYIRIFAGMHPDDVAGMVLVDPTPDTEQIEHATGLPELESWSDTLEYRRWLGGIPGSHLVVTNRSGHNVAQEEPELVVETIRAAVEEVARAPQRQMSR